MHHEELGKLDVAQGSLLKVKITIEDAEGFTTFEADKAFCLTFTAETSEELSIFEPNAIRPNAELKRLVLAFDILESDNKTAYKISRIKKP